MRILRRLKKTDRLNNREGEIANLFDTEWYLEKYPDVRLVSKKTQDVFQHYIEHGRREGRSPHPLFDSDWYLWKYPEVGPKSRELEMDIFSYFLSIGAQEGHSPHPLFDSAWYWEKYADARASFADRGETAISHYLRVGSSQNYSPHPLFDAAWFQEKLAAEKYMNSSFAGDPLSRYITNGWNSSIDPHPLFDSRRYYEIYPDVEADSLISKEAPLVHYLKHGQYEGRSPHALFDADWYIKNYPEVVEYTTATKDGALSYYVKTGYKQGHCPHPLFDAQWYYNNYLKDDKSIKSFDEDVLSYHLKYGWGKGFKVRPIFAAMWHVQSEDLIANDIRGRRLGVYDDILNSFNSNANNVVYASFVDPYDIYINAHEGNIECHSTGTDPQLYLSIPNQEGYISLVPGLYRISLSLNCLTGDIVNPVIYLDSGFGISEAENCKKKFSKNSDGNWVIELNTKISIAKIRFDPSDAECSFEKLSLSIEKIRNPEDYVSIYNLGTSNDRYKTTYDYHISVSHGARSPSFAPIRDSILKVDENSTKVICFYLPQFHPFPENDKWWGKGFTEWTNVTKAVPQYEGHYQPRLPGELGFYDLRLPEIMDRQIELARMYGVYGFCFHYYWFAGKRLLEKPIEAFLSNKSTSSDFPFCLCWANENWTRRWDGDEKDVLIKQEHSTADNINVIKDLSRYFMDNRYIRFNGKPVIVIYRPDIIPDVKQMAVEWRQWAKLNGYPGLHIVTTNAFGFSDPLSIGFDAIVEFPPHNVVAADISQNLNIINDDYNGSIYKYDDVVSYSTNRLKNSTDKKYPYYPSVMTSWDNCARKPSRGNVFHGSTPKKFEFWLNEVAVWSNEKNTEGNNFVFINAWNEWGEGTYLEPDRRYGYAYLSAVSSVIGRQTSVSSYLFNRALEVERMTGRSSDSVVCLHMFYEDMIEEFRNYMDLARNVSVLDVILSIPNTWKDSSLDYAIKALKPVRVVVTENCGRDVWPFLQSLKIASDMGYKFACKIHSKKSPHISGGERWRRDLVNSIVGASAIKSVMDVFQDEDNCGIVAPRSALFYNNHSSVMVDNQEWVKNILDVSGNSGASVKYFIAGTMFWLRIDAFKSILNLPYGSEEFGPELGAIDGTLAHALERVMPLLVEADGYKLILYGDEGSFTPY